jgi:hypothetical protein
MQYTLDVNDIIIITTKDDKTYEAKLLDKNPTELFITLISFGRIILKWESILTVHKIVEPKRRKKSFSPRYKILVWRSDMPELQAS